MAESLRFDSPDIIGHIDESNNVNSELTKDGTNDVRVEDVWLWPFFGKLLNRLW
jgi:hypothetical protein